MNRRAFLLSFAALGTAGAATYVVGPRRVKLALERRYLDFVEPSTEELAAELEKSFAHLRLKPGVAARFIADHKKADPYPLRVPFTDEFRKRFLLSTDFVVQRGAPEAEIDYVAYYDPYTTYCYNPYMLIPRPEKYAI